MTRRLLLTLAPLLACVTLPPIAAAADRAPAKLGFLFATRNPECSQQTLCPSEFNTFLVVVDGEKIRVALNSPHLYVPRKDGFWEIGMTLPSAVAGKTPRTEDRTLREASEESVWQLWAAPLGMKPSLPEPPPNAEGNLPEQEGISDDSDELHWFVLTWVGTDYLSVNEQVGEYTTRRAILPIDVVSRNQEDTPWTPKVSHAIVRNDIEDCVDEKSGFNTHDFLDDADQAWSITRGKMRWEFAWTFSHSGRALRGYETACATSQRPPKELVGNDRLGVGWNQVLSKVPDAQTAFSSPDQSIVLAFTKTQILAMRREANGLGAPFGRVFLPVSDILSAQWAVGRYADQWAEQLSRAESWNDKNRHADKR